MCQVIAISILLGNVRNTILICRQFAPTSRAMFYPPLRMLIGKWQEARSLLLIIFVLPQ